MFDTGKHSFKLHWKRVEDTVETRLGHGENAFKT